MKIRIELAPEEVELAIRNYIRQSGMAIPDDGDVTVKRLPGEIYLGATYEVEIE